MRSFWSLMAVLVFVPSCQDEADDEKLSSGPCTEDVGLVAYADRIKTASGVRVFGESAAPAGVTVRAIHVAGEPVPKTAFNYRGWQVDLSQEMLEAVAVDDVAVLSVVAYVNDGCQTLETEKQPRVQVIHTGTGIAGGGGSP